MRPFAPQDRVLVSPRYLAGAGIDRLADAIGPLVHLFGWQSEHDRASGRISVHSPDGSLFVNFNSRQTPIEAIAAVTQALPQLLGDDRHIDRIPLTTTPLAQIAELNHWHREDDTFTSPDGHCHLQHTPAEDTPWRFRHHVYDGFDTHWDASFTQDTPERLVAQFFTHLATTTPVERTFRDVPYLVQNLDDALITPVHRAAVNPHVHHAGAQLGRVVHRR
ncbi:DUF317 domain-containing protein [Streptomyces diastaticus]